MSAMITLRARTMAGCVFAVVLGLVALAAVLHTVHTARTAPQPAPAIEYGRVLDLSGALGQDPLAGTDAGLVTQPATLDD